MAVPSAFNPHRDVDPPRHPDRSLWRPTPAGAEASPGGPKPSTRESSLGDEPCRNHTVLDVGTGRASWPGGGRRRPGCGVDRPGPLTGARRGRGAEYRGRRRWDAFPDGVRRRPGCLVCRHIRGGHATSRGGRVCAPAAASRLHQHPRLQVPGRGDRRPHPRGAVLADRPLLTETSRVEEVDKEYSSRSCTAPVALRQSHGPAGMLITRMRSRATARLQARAEEYTRRPPFPASFLRAEMMVS